MHTQEQFQLSHSPDNSLMAITPRTQQHGDPNRVIHYYIQEQNTKGRFIPNLLLLDKLHSKVDSTNNTLLSHMCSYNSPYLHLLLDSLPEGDELINKRNNFGNSPLEIASLYSTKSVMNKLKAKGANGDIGPDYWAIRGGNLANWSGQVPMDKKELVHWAAYNDLPEVLAEFNRLGVSLVETDQNGSTPIDIATSNKSYRAFKYLLDLGYRPNPDKLKVVDSPSMNKMYFEAVNPKKPPHPIFFFVIFILFQYFLQNSTIHNSLFGAEFILYVALSWGKEPRPRTDQNNRVLDFQSKLLRNKIQWGSNHLIYMIFNLLVFVTSAYTLKDVDIDGYPRAFAFLVVLLVTLCFGGNFILEFTSVSIGQTHSQMFRRNLHPELYRKIKVVKELQLVYHDFHNPRDRGFLANWKYYCSLY